MSNHPGKLVQDFRNSSHKRGAKCALRQYISVTSVGQIALCPSRRKNTSIVYPANAVE